ncbi:MAG: hypothetical protein M3176_02590 [Chloroflexota bacterium]|nr:hypothetical protein [Chloroflexota bacterium]
MPTVATEMPGTPLVPQENTTHQRLVFAADSLQVAATLFAPTEGHVRFVARSGAVTIEPQRGISGVLLHLGEQCGYPVSAAMATAAVVSGSPLHIRVIGEPSATDTAALEAIERFGIATVIPSPAMPPRRPERGPSWVKPTIEALHNGRIEAILVLIPPGTLPVWAAQILTEIGENAPVEASHCIIIASDADLATVVPVGATLVIRDDHLAPRVASVLNRIRAGHLLPGMIAGTSVISRPEALVAAARMMRAASETSCVFVDVSDGTTMVVADEPAVVVHHDPGADFSCGAPALLLRCGVERIARWLPFPIDERTLRAWAIRRASLPVAPLVAREDILIASAFAHAAVSHLIEIARIGIPNNAHWIIGSALARLISPSTAVCFVADLLPASGVAMVTGDTDDLFAAVGALSISYPADASDLLAQDARITIGSAVRTTLTSDRRGSAGQATLIAGERTWKADVASNALTTIACDDTATLTVHGSKPSHNRLAVHGGVAGIVIDTRRRPVDAASSAAERPNVSGRLRTAAAMEDSSHD